MIMTYKLVTKALSQKPQQKQLERLPEGEKNNTNTVILHSNLDGFKMSHKNLFTAPSPSVSVLYPSWITEGFLGKLFCLRVNNETGKGEERNNFGNRTNSLIATCLFILGMILPAIRLIYPRRLALVYSKVLGVGQSTERCG